MSSPCDNVPAQVAGQRFNPAKGQTSLPTSEHLAIHYKEAKAQHFVPWWSLNSHPNHKPHQGSSSQGRRAGQHDHGGEGAPIPGSIRYFWACIREFHPKEARSHGPSHTSTSQTRGFHQTSQYLLPSECPR